MKKSNLLKLTLLTAVAVLSGINVYKSHKETKFNVLTMANIEALADNSENDGGSNGESVEDCNIYLYNRNHMEYYRTCDIQVGADGGFYVKIGNRVIKLGAEAGIHSSVRVPECIISEGNCCLKSFINNDPIYF